MQKCQYRKMWMFPRNIRRIDPWKLVQITQLIEACEGNITSQSVQDELYRMLGNLGVKVEANKARVANSGGFRTYLAQLACLGFFWRDPETLQYSTTLAGEYLSQACDPLTLLRCQLMRMQYPSVYGLGHNVSISPELKVKPLRFLVRLLMDERLGFAMTCDEMAVPVIYGRTEDDLDRCVEKILKMREVGGMLEEVIDSVDDLRTPRRCYFNDPDRDFVTGVEDAKQIANTAKNYLLAAILIAPCEDNPKAFELIRDESICRTISPWLTEKIEPLDPAYSAAWQQRYGRFNQSKAVRSLQKRSLDGFEILIRTCFISRVSEEPYGFDLDAFVRAESTRWGKTPNDILRAIDPLRERVVSLEREVVTKAAYSGGKGAVTLEKATAHIFQKLGFTRACQTGQKRSGRLGGYPDVWLQTEDRKQAGWVDVKATMRYDFPASDLLKLGQYYKTCEQELDPTAHSSFFLYVAGDFARSEKIVRERLLEAEALYGRPVSALTVGALLDLAEMSAPPSPQVLANAFTKGEVYSTAIALLNATGLCAPSV